MHQLNNIKLALGMEYIKKFHPLESIQLYFFLYILLNIKIVDLWLYL
jgi:hypothetical protein